ncbi:hypothetical protein [Burkholderia sp. WAC0059]|uniref:hypothetical protein n=1 Tax=Burkholderia sp. WAC0059 TaxID=2066022 RepID=UPI0011AF0872|nr:hypothetical protein [Burkholderia sp. WAC0059]
MASKALRKGRAAGVGFTDENAATREKDATIALWRGMRKIVRCDVPSGLAARPLAFSAASFRFLAGSRGRIRSVGRRLQPKTGSKNPHLRRRIRFAP